MGHYDDCYAQDDYKKMTLKEKESVWKSFDKEFKKKGSLYGTYDDVYGWLLAEWAEQHCFAIHREGMHNLSVDRHTTKEEVLKMLQPRKPFKGLPLK
jgi:hypothetical protein